VNITARRRVCDIRRSPLSGVKHDPLLYSRHNGRDRTVKVGREIIVVLGPSYGYC